MNQSPYKTSIIIPVLQDSKELTALIHHLNKSPNQLEFDIIVVEGDQITGWTMETPTEVVEEIEKWNYSLLTGALATKLIRLKYGAWDTWLHE